MSLPEHLFDQVMAQHPRPVLGVVRGVRHGTDANPLTLYDVEIWPQTAGFTGSFQFNSVVFLGQQAGGAIEKNDPLVVGQKVALEFAEGDYNRPMILERWGDKSTALQSEANKHPQADWKINGLLVSVEKDGDVVLQLPEAKTITIKDKDGNQIVKISEGGGVELGDGTLRRVVDERIVAAIHGLSWTIPALTVSGLATMPSATTGVFGGSFTVNDVACEDVTGS